MKGQARQHPKGSPQAVRPAPRPVAVPVPAVAPKVAQVLPAVDEETPKDPVEEEKPEGYTPQEAAQVLGSTAAGFTGKSIRRHIRSQVCPATKHGGRWYVTQDQLVIYLDKLEALKAAKALKEAEEAAKAAAEVAAVTQIELPKERAA